MVTHKEPLALMWMMNQTWTLMKSRLHHLWFSAQRFTKASLSLR
jgi:hypothetical protein